MHLTPRLNEAIKLSSHLHRNQLRKDKYSTPYISHLFSVATLLSSVTDDEDVIIAGLMHDSLEDVPHYTYDDLIRDCGTRVAQIVKHVTEPLDANKEEGDQLPWLTRKEAYLKVLKDGGEESALVALADKVHNTESMVQGYQEGGREFIDAFPSSLSNKLWFTEEALLICKEKAGDIHPLVLRLETAIKQMRLLVLKESEGRI